MCDKKINDIMFFFAVLSVVLVMHLHVFTIEECMTHLEHLALETVIEL